METRGLIETNQDGDDKLDKDSDGCTNRSKGYAYAVAGLVLGMVGPVVAQELNSIPQSVLNACRFVAQFFFAVPFLMAKDSFAVDRSDMFSLICAVSAKVVYICSAYGSRRYLALGTARAVAESLVLAANCVISCVVRQSGILWQIVATVACTVGVFMLVQPPGIFGGDLERQFGNVSRDYWALCRENFTDIQSEDSSHLHVGYILVSVESTARCVEMNILSRKLPHVQTHFYVLLFAATGLVVSLAAMMFETPYFPPSPTCAALAAVFAVSVALSAIWWTKSSQLLPPFITSLFRMMVLPVMFALQSVQVPGLLPGRGNVLEVCGALMVVAGVSVLPVVKLVTTTGHDLLSCLAYVCAFPD